MRRRPVCILCLLLVVFLCVTDWLGFSLIRGNPLPESVQTWIKKHPESTICGEVVRCQENEDVISVYLKNTYLIYYSEEKSDLSLKGQSEKEFEKISIYNVKVYLKKKKKLPAGSLVLVSGKLEEIKGPSNPGEFDSRQYYACRHTYYVMKKGNIEGQSRNHSVYGQFLINMQQKFADILEKAGGEEAGVFEAIVLGDKSNLDAELKMRYQMAGIIHILAISGLHISLLGMGLYELLKKAGLGIWPAGILALVIMLQYGMMTGGGVSTMRAVSMFLLSVGARIAGRIYDMPTGMAAACILILMESPAYLVDGGFLLSFGSVIGIGCVWPVLEETLKTENKILRSFLASATVQLVTLPVVLWFYGEVSVAGIFLNLLVVPTVGIVLGSGVAGVILGLFYIKGASVVIFPGRVILKIYEFLISVAGELPFCTWIGGKPKMWQIVDYYLILAATVWIERKLLPGEEKAGRGEAKRRKAGCEKEGCGEAGYRKIGCGKAGMIFLAVLVLGYRPGEEFRITCLDVGQGDGTVIEIENQWNLLIDGGSTNKNAVGKYQLLPYLKSRGISRLDGIYISHTDEDHISGVRELLEYMGENLSSVRVENLFLPAWEKVQENRNYQELVSLADTAGIRVFCLKAGDEIRYGNTSLKVLWPQSGASGENVNEDAMVLEMITPDFRGIFTGDIGMETEKKLLQSECLEDVDFLKTAHHGSRYSTGEGFLKVIRPELAVISCSATNTYGHPSPDTVRRLRECGSRVLITKDVGAVMVCRKRGRIFVGSYLGSR